MNRVVLASFCFVCALALKDLGYPNFKCDSEVMKRSQTVPKSVHSLRFADIDLMAALGDSITAANGAGARPHDPVALLIQYRGLTYSVGGQKELDEHITVANIMKKFNKDLYGFSVGTGTSNNWEVSRLNAAIPGAVSGDLLGQAQDLIDHMNAHINFEYQDKWKLVHIFIGGNDLCAYCAHPDVESPENFRDNIKRAVQYLYDNLRNTIVVLTAFLDLSLLRRADADAIFCEALHTSECSCERNKSMSDADLRQVSLQYMAREQELEDSGIFERDDFTLVIQPFFEDDDGTPDLTFFAPDCFHFSQFGHAVVAKNLWNNLNQAVGEKSRMANLTDHDEPLICPLKDCPFIRTTKNSDDCSKYATPTV